MPIISFRHLLIVLTDYRHSVIWGPRILYSRQSSPALIIFIRHLIDPGKLNFAAGQFAGKSAKPLALERYYSN